MEENVPQLEDEWDDLEYQEEYAGETYDGEPIEDYEDQAVDEYEDVYIEDGNLAEELVEYDGGMPEDEVICQEVLETGEYGDESKYEDEPEYEDESKYEDEPEYEDESKYEDEPEYEDESEYEDETE